MAKFYALGNYTTQGFQGFCKDPSSDRSKAAQVAAEAVGAKLISYTGLRGSFDFLAVFEGDFSQAAGVTLHIENIYGDNSHHIIESCFKGLARTLRAALEIDPRTKNAIPSTKGSL